TAVGAEARGTTAAPPRRRHWFALAAALLAAAAVVAAALLVVPAPDPGPPPAPPPLAPFGPRKDGWAARGLAGPLAAVAEYRDGEGGRVTLMRWRGDLPPMPSGSGGDGLARSPRGPGPRE